MLRLTHPKVKMQSVSGADDDGRMGRHIEDLGRRHRMQGDGASLDDTLISKRICGLRTAEDFFYEKGAAPCRPR